MNPLPEQDAVRLDSPERYRETLTAYAPAVLAKAVEEQLREPAVRSAAVADLPGELRPALALLPYVSATGWSVEDLRELLRHLGCSAPEKSIRAFLGLGMFALHLPRTPVKNIQMLDFVVAGWRQAEAILVPHPALMHEGGKSPFRLPQQGLAQTVRNVRENDGLEFLLRVAVLWQRVLQIPLKLTMQG